MLCGASECLGCRRQLSVASGLQVVGVPCNAVVEMGRRIRRAGKKRQTPGGQTGRGVGARAQMQTQTQTRRRVGSGRRSERKGRFPQVKIIENEGATTRTGTRSRTVWSGNTKDACQEIESGDSRIVKLAAHRELCSKGAWRHRVPLFEAQVSFFSSGPSLRRGRQTGQCNMCVASCYNGYICN